MAATTPQGQPGAAGLRVSDAERDAVTAELAEHLRVGRLQMDEFDERAGLAVNAKTRGDLDRLLVDLPRPLPPQPPQDLAVRRGVSAFPLVAIMIFVAGVVLLGGLSHATAGHGYWHQHPGWSALPYWGLIPVAIFVAYRRLGRNRG